ncbi:unnamed protein product [Hymenolepis diminuta]|uniref:Uncharacterized protein n=1 Tax=Hymenolepis diminuta TaxID=6216 RepID=A0A564YFZ6_HYMDI|nr:unnamed protein product [Hymenolepis diminuta]
MLTSCAPNIVQQVILLKLLLGRNDRSNHYQLIQPKVSFGTLHRTASYDPHGVRIVATNGGKINLVFATVKGFLFSVLKTVY